MHCTVKLRGAPQILWGDAVSLGHKVYAFGRKEDRINVYVFNTVSLRWRTLPPVTTTTGERPPEVPCSRCGHTAVLIEDIVYLWGGWNKYRIYDNMLYAFDACRWIMTKVSGTVPEGCRGHSACVLGKVMYIHGGCTKAYGRTNDVYKLDTTTMVWSLINTGGTLPFAEAGHSATIIGTKMFVFGGVGGRQVFYNNIRVFDTETDCWLDIPSAKHLPEERFDHSAFAYNGELYIFGGRNWSGEDYCGLMWRFSPETFSWKEFKPKVNDSFWRTRGCCCMVGSRAIIFGGVSTPNNDLYILDLSPSLKTLCKLAVIQYGLERSDLPHDIRWELAAMTD